MGEAVRRSGGNVYDGQRETTWIWDGSRMRERNRRRSLRGAGEQKGQRHANGKGSAQGFGYTAERGQREDPQRHKGERRGGRGRKWAV